MADVGQLNPYPTIDIRFKTLARIAIQRGERGHLYIILADVTNEVKLHEFRSVSGIKESDWTEKNFKIINTAFELYAPNRVFIRNMQPDETLSNILAELESKKVTHLAMPYAEQAEDTQICTWVKSRWINQGIIYGSSFSKNQDSSTIIQVGNTEFTHSLLGAMTAQEFTVSLMGAVAGCPLNVSLDNKIFPNITSCDAVEPELGVFNMYMENDAVRVNRAINSRITFNDEWKDVTREIKVVEGMNIVRFDIRDTFKNYWLGNYDNSYENKMAFCNLVKKSYFASLAPDVLSADYDNTIEIDIEKQKQFIIGEGKDPYEMTDLEILRYPTGGNVFLKGDVRFSLTMINLDLTIYM